MNAASRLIGLSIALTFAVGCSSKVDTSIQLNQVEVTKSGKLAWSNADRPSLVDLDDSYNYKFDELPTQGEAAQIPWAGDYWSTYKDSINQKVLGEELSPAAKFGQAFNRTENMEDAVSVDYGVDARPTADICSADSDCEAKNGVQTVCAKRAGQEKGYCIETWTGICHAWAPAAIMEKEPENSVTKNGVEFTVMDLKGLITLAYDKGLQSEFVGTRCDEDLNATGDDAIEFDEYGRPVGCFDTNPGTLHLILSNLIGIQGKTLVEDRTIDYQVWNQPIRGYEVLTNEEITAQQANELLKIIEGARNENIEGKLAKEAWLHYGPFDVAAGEKIDAVMTGTGDADLYVRFGEQPTKEAYDCRPYANGTNETCNLVAEEGQTQVFISVNAYSVPEGSEELEFKIETVLGGSVPENYKHNDNATKFRKMRTKVTWIAESYAAVAADRDNTSATIDNYTKNDIYDYILEIDADGKIIGGEWYDGSATHPKGANSLKDHPDFLWLPTVKTDVEVALPPTWHINEDITIAAGEWKDYGSFDVQEGQKISLTINGDGDADMYVGLSQAPNDDYNACSATISTEEGQKSKQVCAGTVGAGWNKIFVKVKGVAETSNIRVRVHTQTPGTGIKWSEVQELLEMSLNPDPCADNNGGCDADYFTCQNNNGAALCVDINECATDNGGCGASMFTKCINNEGAAPTCQDIDECATNNGNCGNPSYVTCVNNAGAAPTCNDILECETNNPCDSNATCTEKYAAAPSCECKPFFNGDGYSCSDILECETNNPCTADQTCQEQVGAAPICEDNSNGGDNGNGNNGGDSGGSTGGFNWGSACEGGSGQFSQPISYRDTVVVGDIPANKASVFIKLTSTEDVDVQLIDKATGHEIIAWPNGDLNGHSEACTSYEGVRYCYSGYNGTNGSLGNEWIRIEGTTNRLLTMRAYGYKAGDAIVDYSWSAPTGCVDAGEGSFQQEIVKDDIVEVGVIPAGKSNIKIQLTAAMDIDIQLYDGSTKLVAWAADGNHGMLSGAARQVLDYQGIKIVWSGYNGTDGQKGNEYIHIIGTVPSDFTMKVFGYEAGDATVDYAWGVDPAELN